MATARERLVEWLRDAHAAEEQAQTFMRGTADRIKSYPEFSARLHQHGELSGRQAERVKECLSRLGESPSLMKQLGGRITAVGQTLSGLVVGDEIMKAALATATFAQMEVSSYRILATAAEAAGESTITEACETVLAEEVEFLDWLEQQLPSLTDEYLRREDTGARAKN
jgi:ferritin-like metal-binding protein YciE